MENHHKSLRILIVLMTFKLYYTSGQTCPDQIRAFVSKHRIIVLETRKISECNSTDDCSEFDLDCVQINGQGYCCKDVQ